MDCNTQIHDELKIMEESTCPFCDQQLVEVDEAVEPCCGEQNMKNIDGMNTCVNCGSILGYVFVDKRIDLYENMYKIRKKSVYCRKYHIENVMNSISFENSTELTHSQRDRIYKVFVEIGTIIPLVNRNCKRMISVKFIMKKLFKILGLRYKDINVTKSKKTLKYYKQYWEKVQSLVGDRIQSIINM